MKTEKDTKNKYRKIVEETAKKLQIKSDNESPDLKTFLNNVFEEATKEFHLCKAGFQTRAKVFGEVFEVAFDIVMENLFPDVKVQPAYTIPEACMEKGGEADFVVLSNNQYRIVAVIEAKGAADHIICDGKLINLERPGLLRTDTVKKAISNAVQVKYGLSKDVLFLVVTSHKPESGNSKCMIDLAIKAGLFDMVVDITNYAELKEMVDLIKKKLKNLE